MCLLTIHSPYLEKKDAAVGFTFFLLNNLKRMKCQILRFFLKSVFQDSGSFISIFYIVISLVWKKLVPNKT